MPQLLLSITIGYLLGSIPFAYLIARARGADIFTVGTRNPGAANVYRQIGPVPGSLVFLLDIAKAAAAVLIATFILSGSEGSGWPLITLPPEGEGLDGGVVPELLILPGLAAIVGHWFPVFLKFRGGVGLATAIGASAGALALAGIVAIAAGLLFQWKFKSSGHSALVGLIVYLGIGIGMGHWTMALSASSTFAAVFIYYLVGHRLTGKRP